MNKVRLKYLTKEPLQYGINIDATNYKGSGIRFLRTTDLNDEGEIVGEGIYLDKENVPENYLLNKGDILFSRSGTIGRAYFHQTDEPMTYAGFLVRFRLNDVELAKWIYYYSKTPDFKYILNSEAIESTIQNFNGQKFNNIAIPITHLQLTINNYLDTQTQKINHFIAKKQQFIALLKEQRQSVINEAVTKGLNYDSSDLYDANDLGIEKKNQKNQSNQKNHSADKRKMKDSGIQWLGYIPEHWEVMRLANIGTFSKGGNISRAELIEDENGIPAILYGDIYTKYDIVASKIINRISEETASNSVVIKKGDLLFIGSGETKEDIGKCIVYNGDETVYAGGDVIIFKQQMFDSVFISYSQNTSYAQMQKLITAKGDIIVHTYSSKLKNVIMPYPPKEEQTQIVNHIKTETATIDTAIAKTVREIELIKEYKEAMIAEAVMGKVKMSEL